MGVVRMLVTSAFIGVEGSARTGAGVTELAIRRTPSLVVLGTRATVQTGAQAARAQAEFRDGLLTLLDDAAEIAWRQARRARDELGLRTSPEERDPAAAAWEPGAAAGNGQPHRRHRVKA